MMMMMNMVVMMMFGEEDGDDDDDDDDDDDPTVVHVFFLQPTGLCGLHCWGGAELKSANILPGGN